VKTGTYEKRMKSHNKIKRKNSPPTGINRRQFIKEACLLTAGAVGTLDSLARGAQPVVNGESVPGKMMYRRLGRTNLNISVVVGGEMDHHQMYERAYELGVNYWHKVGNFPHPGPEFFKGKDRDSFYCDMVIDTLDKDGAIAQFEWGLKQSGLERIDFIKIHSLYREPRDIQKYGGIFKAFDYLKKRGKVRFMSIAQHGNTAEICTACIESGLFDAIQPNFNLFSPPEMYDVIAFAKKHDVGVICKKVLAGGERLWQRRPDRKREVEFQIDKSGYTLGQAMLKWVLDVPGITAVVPLITNFEHLEEDIAVGFVEKTLPSAASRANRRALVDLAGDLSSEYCRSCGQCVSTCPKQIPVPDIFRYDLYFSAYKRTKNAKLLYAEIPSGQTADHCIECGTCEETCPHSLPIMAKLRRAHSKLGTFPKGTP